MLLQQPSLSCRLVNKIDFWRSGERQFDAWQVFIPKMMSYRWSETLKLTHLSQRWSRYIWSPPSDAVTNSLLRRYSWRDLVFMSTSMVPAGDNRVTFDHFSRRHWLVVSLSPTAPLLWNMLPREVQTSSSMLVFNKKVLSLLDSPVSGKNLLQICFENTSLPSNYFSSFLSFLFLPFRVGPL